MALATFELQILAAEDYDAVRAAIDISLDASALPDSIIDLYGPDAESEVLARDPLALTYQPGGTAVDAVKWTRIRRAARFLTGAWLCGALPAITSEKVGADAYTRTAFDADKRAAQLRGLAAVELAAVLEVDGLTRPLTGFWTIPGYRGR